MLVDCFKQHPNARLPVYATKNSACFDLHAAAFNDMSSLGIGEERQTDSNGSVTYYDSIVVDTGLVFMIPSGHGLFVFSRSGQIKEQVTLANCVGVVDADYRGTVKVVLRRNVTSSIIYDSVMAAVGYDVVTQPLVDAVSAVVSTHKVSIGDRVAQACVLPVPQCDFREVFSITDTERGAGGFGSTGVR